jgi:hypothetical protein
MTTLDMPQHLFVCRVCHRSASTGRCPDHADAGVTIEPTLLYVDFARYTEACRLAGRLIPSDADLWDWLESHADTAATNRLAINNAIRRTQERTT